MKRARDMCKPAVAWLGFLVLVCLGGVAPARDQGDDGEATCVSQHTVTWGGQGWRGAGSSTCRSHHAWARSASGQHPDTRWHLFHKPPARSRRAAGLEGGVQVRGRCRRPAEQGPAGLGGTDALQRRRLVGRELQRAAGHAPCHRTVSCLPGATGGCRGGAREAVGRGQTARGVKGFSMAGATGCRLAGSGVRGAEGVPTSARRPCRGCLPCSWAWQARPQSRSERVRMHAVAATWRSSQHILAGLGCRPP